jgi:SAM-dependent methyltransferase
VRTRLYGATIFGGSLLLFLVQPIMAKAILPWFGGAAGVWASSLFFFQAVLLAGYAYAWLSTRYLPPRGQALVHILLLAASLAFLPIHPRAVWNGPGPEGDPAAHIVVLLAASVGLPYFLLAAGSPMIQAWFARSAKPAFPYRLFALSNLASLAALLLYPVAVEPLLAVSRQLQWWSAAYAVVALMGVAAAVWTAGAGEPRPATMRSPARADLLLWFVLAACPSILWMATANTLSQSVAPIPFLWILPLSIYLLSLILCFDREGWHRPAILRVAVPLSCVAMGLCAGNYGAGLDVRWTIALFAAALFVCCMFCHGELAHRKPAPDRLPVFYLTLAAGGAAGGLFVAILAPQLFSGFLELPIGVTMCAILALALLFGVRSRARLVRLTLFAAAGFVAAVRMDSLFSQTRVWVRNFYGAVRVHDRSDVRILSNGAIHHGAEFLLPGRERVPTTYYGRESGVGRAIAGLPQEPRAIGAIGLGAGTLASYARPGDSFRFYEINPAVIDVARSEFRFLDGCPGRVEVVAGDGRLSLQRDIGQRFDLLAVDAFSGDAIPLHLLTAEAFQLYRDRLKPEGVLAVHITNRYLNLIPEALALAAHAGFEAHVVRNDPNPDEFVYEATWVVARPRGIPPRSLARVWTDDYSNLLGAMR